MEHFNDSHISGEFRIVGWNQFIDIDNELLYVEVLAERAMVIVDDVSDSYFGRDIMQPCGVWRATPLDYRIAAVKMGIANTILLDLMEQLKVCVRQLMKLPKRRGTKHDNTEPI